MEEQPIEVREKKGIELLPSLHGKLKQQAAVRRIPMCELLEEILLERFEKKPPDANHSTKHQEWIDKLIRVLNSGNDTQIKTVCTLIELYAGVPKTQKAIEKNRNRA